MLRCFLCACVGLATLLLGNASAAPHAFPPVKTLVQVRGWIQGFAQDGDRIVWANGVEPCRRSVHIRRLSTGATASLPACGVDAGGGMQHRMALGGKRALWANVGVSHTAFHFYLFTASPGDRRARMVGSVHTAGGLEDDSAFRPVPLAGDGPALVYADISSAEDQGPAGVVTVGRRRRLLPGTERTFALAAHGGKLALARSIERGCLCNRAPSWSPDGRSILFTSTLGAEGGWNGTELFAMNADGSGLRRLTHRGGGIGFGSWSPDGKSLAFTHRGTVIRASADGKSERRIGAGYAFQWSPDSRWIALTRSAGIFIAPSNGGRPVRLAPADGYGPSWSPDARKIVFTRENSLWVVDVASRSVRRIVTLEGANSPHEAAWSPDGSRIAYVGGPGVTRLHVVASDGSGDESLAPADRGVAWSPDSSTIAFLVSSGPPSYTPQMQLISADGGSPRTLAPGSSPSWSPDGRTIAFIAPAGEPGSGNGEVARIAADGSSRQVLTTTTAAPARNAVELRKGRSGKLTSSFDAAAMPQAVAFSGRRIALLLIHNRSTSTVEVRTAGGSAVRRVSIPRPSGDEILMSARWVVFRTGQVIRALEIASGRRTILARAHDPVVGLSVEGKRVAWAEQGQKTSRIRALVLP